MEREGWKRAMQDYEAAYKIARKVWPADTPPEVIQSATATLLIHHKNMPPVVSGAQKAGPAPAKASAPTPDGAPACPKCGGAMKDVRADKRSEKSPDFQCLQQKGQCGKTDAAKGKFYPTGKWSTPLPPKSNPVREAAEKEFGPLEEVPAALQDDSDELPW